MCAPRSSARVATSALVGMAASFSAIALAAATASSATSQIMPMAFASVALSLSPVMHSAMARARPTRCGSSQVPPLSGTSPILLKAWMKLAPGAAMAMSHAMATDAPAPAATPLTAHTVGTRTAIRRRVVGLKAWSITGPGSARNMMSSPARKSNSDRSAPAQNARPAPVSTNARIDLSASTSSSAAHRSRCIWRVKLLSEAGRFSVRMAMGPSCAKRTVGSAVVLGAAVVMWLVSSCINLPLTDSAVG